VRLRTRLATTVLVTMALLFAGALWVRAVMERSSTERALIEYATDRMQSGGREACESDPTSFVLGTGRWRGPPPGSRPWEGPRMPTSSSSGPPSPPPDRAPDSDGRPGDASASRPPTHRYDSHFDRWPRIEVWAYAPDFTSANPAAPVFPATLRAELEDGERQATEDWRDGDRPGVQAALRMEWSEGPCAVVLARRSAPPRSSSFAGPMLAFAGQCLLLVVAVVLAAGPIVRRVRKLDVQMRESAAARYAKPVDVEGADEVSELAQTFNAAAGEVRDNLESLEARERALRTFVENTTHDVMIPLTVLQGHLTALRRASEAGAPIERGVVLDSLQEAHYMASLIQNLAAAARLESGAGELVAHQIDLNALVERAVGRHRPIARARGISLEHAVPPTALTSRGDVTLVEQAVSNLIHNAVRYVQPGGHVAVVLEERGPRFSLRVLDDGPGVPEVLRAKVFERTFRADDARSRQPDGLGLGLSIARDVAHRHGFSLELRSPAEGGTELELSGPLDPPAA
jgi:signal transduction histidine kinase